MRTFSSIKGQPVLAANGIEIGKVVDFSLDEKGQLSGVIIDTGRLIHRHQIIPITDLKALGTDVVLTGHASQERLRKKTQNKCVESMLGKPMVTSNGENIGLLEDVYIQENLGTIVGYEVSDGFFADISEGRKVLENTSISIGEDTIVVTT